MRLALAFALICAAVAALPAPAAADMVVRRDERIGSFRVKSDGTLGGARNAFGVPSRSVRTSDATCSVTWARLGLRIDRVSRLRTLYPGARYRVDGFGGEGWWLVARRNATGPGTYPGLLARTRAGHVTALVVRYPAGGD